MNKIVIYFIIFSLVCVMPVFAAKGGNSAGGPKFFEKGSSERAYEGANENAAFKRKEKRKKEVDEKKKWEDSEGERGDINSFDLRR